MRGSERHLRLVAARRADDREVLAIGALDAPLVAARAADLADVVAPIAGRAPAGAAARAALRVGCEPLLDVVLLIGCRVDELDAAVDAVQGPISVGHVAPPGAMVGWVRCGGRPHRQSGNARSGERSRAPATQVPMWSPCLRGAPVLSAAQDTTGSKIGHTQRRRSRLAAVTTYLSQWRATIRDGERGVMGAPRSRHLRISGSAGSLIARPVSTARGQTRADATDHPHRGRPPRRAPRRPR